MIQEGILEKQSSIPRLWLQQFVAIRLLEQTLHLPFDNQIQTACVAEYKSQHSEKYLQHATGNLKWQTANKVTVNLILHKSP